MDSYKELDLSPNGFRSVPMTEEAGMMYWGNNGMNGWGFALMSVSMALFWVLLIAGVVLLVRYLSDHHPQTPDRAPHQVTGEQILAERFARGEIDDDEYHRRLQTLRGRHSTQTQ